jgi:hypothetical protein
MVRSLFSRRFAMRRSRAELKADLTKLADEVLDEQDAIRPVPGPQCPTCGREMHYKDMKPNTVESRVGNPPYDARTEPAAPDTEAFEDAPTSEAQ